MKEKITEKHGEVAFEMFEHWYADAIVRVNDPRLDGEEFEITVERLINLLAQNDWNLHGYRVNTDQGKIWDANGNLVIEVIG